MKQRIITGIAAAAVFLPIVYIGGLAFTVLTFLMATIAIFELLRMKNIPIFSFPGVLSTLLLWIFLLPKEYSYVITDMGLTKIELALLAVLLFLSYTVVTKNKFTFDDVGFVSLTTIYIGLGFYYLIETRLDLGLNYIFFALIVVWATDSGAYFIGRAIGKRKLWPDISPNKTIEGSLGGIFVAIIVALIYTTFVTLELTFVELVIVTIFLSVFGQLGDLVESALKRHYDVKDSGKLLPGHGGILDRVDSWLFALPILYYLLLILS
ncbi:phosphatidate cytidylyltransferase [Litchfieldia salsa]|uniref:Phosphatidate cytidylyltransferase n=1 Tax=Litchfieldia salsa TaxID=930152 RepID=A0A1H0R5Z1_9BACI|nr:phosphatidate cytidylyltransferase [Litchfieldia salsa]SDP24579.1 phosphatidate cytidylyltransferase [Litchfieldia salsa]